MAASAAPKLDVYDGVDDPNMYPPLAADDSNAGWLGLDPNMMFLPNTDLPVAACLVFPSNTVQTLLSGMILHQIMC